MTAPAPDGHESTDGEAPSLWTREAEISAAVIDICDQRALIEQVKGVLMCVYDIDDAAAFELLRRLSMETNIKLRALAGQLMTEFRTLTAASGVGMPSRTEFDRILQTVHERV